MNVQGKINRRLNTGGKSIVEIEIPEYQAAYLEELAQEELLNFKITKAKSKKTTNQNNTAWQIINDIAKAEGLYPDSIEIYLQVLKLAKIKTDYYQLQDLEPDERGRTPLSILEKQFRTVKVVMRGVNEKGNDVITVEVGIGMSEFTREEMRDFIKVLLYYAQERGVDTSRYDFERR